MTGRDKGKGRIISIHRVKYTAIVEGANLCQNTLNQIKIIRRWGYQERSIN